jgi:hypothetical protein
MRWGRPRHLLAARASYTADRRTGRRTAFGRSSAASQSGVAAPIWCVTQALWLPEKPSRVPHTVRSISHLARTPRPVASSDPPQRIAGRRCAAARGGKGPEESAGLVLADEAFQVWFPPYGGAASGAMFT